MTFLRDVGFKEHSQGGLYYKNYWHGFDGLRQYKNNLKNNFSDDTDNYLDGELIIKVPWFD